MIETRTEHGFTIVSVGRDSMGRRSPEKKLTSRQTLEISDSNEDAGLLALCYGVSASTIYKIRSGDAKKKNQN